jgi:hypothetical protein
VLKTLLVVFPQAERGIIALKNAGGTLGRRWPMTRGELAGEVAIIESIVHHALDAKKAVLNAAIDRRYAVCIPLVDAVGDPIGVIQLETRTRHSWFERGDLELLLGAACVIESSIATEQSNAVRNFEVARHVNQSLVPAELPRVEGYEFYSFYRPAPIFGGDFYTYIPTPDGRLAFILADVLDKGIAAGLCVARLSGELRHLIRSGESPGEVVKLLNDSFASSKMRVVTLALLVLDPTKHELTVVNAGHRHPVLRTKKGMLGNLTGDERGRPLGVLEGEEYQAVQHKLRPGDTVVVFTDGVVDAENEKKERYYGRLYQRLELPAESVTELGSNVVTSVLDHIGSGEQADDLSLICLRRVKRGAIKDLLSGLRLVFTQ